MNNENERTAYIQQCGSISQTMLHKTSQTWRLYAVWCYFYKVYKQAKVISCSFEKEKQDCEYRSMRGASRVPYFMSSPGQWWAQMCSLHDVMCHLKCLCFLYDCAHTHTHTQFPASWETKRKVSRTLALQATVVNGGPWWWRSKRKKLTTLLIWPKRQLAVGWQKLGETVSGFTPLFLLEPVSESFA